MLMLAYQPEFQQAQAIRPSDPLVDKELVESHANPEDNDEEELNDNGEWENESDYEDNEENLEEDKNKKPMILVIAQKFA